MRGKQKPAALGRKRVSGDVVGGRPDSRKNTPNTDKMQASTIEVYDGRHHCGSLVAARGGGFLAYRSDGRFIGSFSSDVVASRALWAAKPGVSDD